MAYAATAPSLPDRMMRAARLNVDLFEEVEADTRATTQALTVVVIVSIASGIAGALAGMNQSASGAVGGLISGVIGALIGWAVWSYVIYLVGTRLFGGTATWGEVLRTLGFAESPGVLLILSFIPILGAVVGFVVGIWMLVASFIATRQALDISNGKTIATIIVGVLALIVVVAIISAIFGAVFGVGYMLGAGMR